MLIGTSLEDLPATAVETPIFQDEDECVGDDGDEDDEFEGQTGANYQSGDRTDYLNHEYQAVIEKFTSQLTINFITNPRPGKKLLVLDLDYTLYDPKRRSQRPFMHEFLKAVYRHFDLAIWSQTSWSRLEAKISDIGLLTHPFYRIAFVLDVSSMFSIQRQRSNGTVTQVGKIYT
jgi:ubiquitin-like domain-containing CTD phosphatase 1